MSLELSGTTPAIKGVAGSVSAPAITGDDADTGISFPSANTIKFSTGGVERISITNSGISGTGILTTGGKILQVKQALVNTAVSASGAGTTTFANIAGMEVEITPSASSSKILGYYTVNYGNSTSDRNDLLRITRDGSVVSAIIGSGGSVANGNALARLSTNQQIINHSNMVLDSPATDSLVTYRLQWSGESGATRYMNRRGGSSEYLTTSHLTVMEVAA